MTVTFIVAGEPGRFPREVVAEAEAMLGNLFPGCTISTDQPDSVRLDVDIDPMEPTPEDHVAVAAADRNARVLPCPGCQRPGMVTANERAAGERCLHCQVHL